MDSFYFLFVLTIFMICWFRSNIIVIQKAFSDILIGYWPVLHCCLATSNLLTAPRATILSKWWMYTCTNTRNRRDKTFFTVGKNVFGNGTPASHFVHLIQSHITGFLYIYKYDIL